MVLNISATLNVDDIMKNGSLDFTDDGRIASNNNFFTDKSDVDGTQQSYACSPWHPLRTVARYVMI